MQNYDFGTWTAQRSSFTPDSRVQILRGFEVTWLPIDWRDVVYDRQARQLQLLAASCIRSWSNDDRWSLKEWSLTKIFSLGSNIHQMHFISNSPKRSAAILSGITQSYRMSKRKKTWCTRSLPYVNMPFILFRKAWHLNMGCPDTVAIDWWLFIERRSINRW